ncbi:MAG: RNA methyltransferase [Candidatus Babeliales bacterium]|jgi:23S rRNA (guanosine2251-2'-O)-methyltransferase
MARDVAGELLYGAHPIIEMLKAKKRKLLSIYTTKPLPKAWDRIAPHLPKYVPNIQYVSRDILDRMAGTTDHNNIVAWVSPFRYASKIFDPAKKPFILMLDSLQDVRNLGAILRSAYCIGVDGIVLCKTKSASLTPAAFKASAGLAEHLDIYQTASLKHAVNEFKQAGYHFYMAVLDGKNACTVEYEKPLCLVIGNEAVGITPDLKKMGMPVTLPQKTPDISFNASVAAGILMFYISTKIGKI